MANILIVDDDPDIRELIRFYMLEEAFQVLEAGNGKEAVKEMRKRHVDLVVMDVMMPDMDGWELCSHIKEHYPEVPIIMVTAKRETTQKIKGFNMGADDYLVKPFDPLELAVRVKNLLRRYKIEASSKLPVGNVVLDKNRYEAVWEDGPVPLPVKEFELLFKLASNPGKIYTRNQLIQQIWGTNYYGDERTVDVHIKRLRERFPEERTAFSIVTKRGLGYKLEMKA
ncbi:response regulator transcription factor [Paenibacillus thailandensis]|uniref:Heme response regulator HssR n=2 Tax=Paenibacillus thailandensis TaxID=393250 RepID=A0ABW5QV20_9BACL